MHFATKNVETILNLVRKLMNSTFCFCCYRFNVHPNTRECVAADVNTSSGMLLSCVHLTSGHMALLLLLSIMFHDNGVKKLHAHIQMNRNENFVVPKMSTER